MTILFTFDEYKKLASSIISANGYEEGTVLVRHFPDGESYVRIDSDVKDKDIILLCGLDKPDNKIMAILFFCETAKELGAKTITLVSPYLGYMRQDKRFKDGEAITSKIFAKLLSNYIDRLVTIDPHLHRYESLNEIYNVETACLHSDEIIAAWIKQNIEEPVIIGPDEESYQWVSRVAKLCGCPFTTFIKTRLGDKSVEIWAPEVEIYRYKEFVLLDDIISTANTMAKSAQYLEENKVEDITCIGVHAIFADNAYDLLKYSGTSRIITCNTINHETNVIDVSQVIANYLATQLPPAS